ncbi:MAG: hypothetical protein E7183_04325 [Erysipelotrichaceae bacterium]|nr:hypothetical protein [Erysipelotrichaceae bacterium]
MINRKPSLPKIKEKVFVICEGEGDKIYLNKVLNFYNDKYDIKIFPSNSVNLIVDQLKKVLKVNSENKYYIFFDIDGNYKRSINKLINELKQEGISYKGKIFFVNPIIEYLFIINKINRHPTNFLTKEQYAPLIEKYFGIKKYEGTIKQYNEIVFQISKETFELYINNVSTDGNIVPSSTILDLIDEFK